MSFSKHKKKSIGKIIGWSVLIIPPLLIIIALSINKVHHSYPLAKALPVSQGTKIRAFWYDLDKNKLEKLQEKNKISGFIIDDKIISIVEGQYSYTFSFNIYGGKTILPLVSIRSSDDAPGNKVEISFYTNGTSVGDLYNSKNVSVDEISKNYRDISDDEIDELTKRGLELYNQFIEDYENIKS